MSFQNKERHGGSGKIIKKAPGRQVRHKTDGIIRGHLEG